jgi:hypothetical protein
MNAAILDNTALKTKGVGSFGDPGRGVGSSPGELGAKVVPVVGAREVSPIGTSGIL